MFNIGIDFDNTIVNYDESFYELALEKGLITKGINNTKYAVRNFLREKGKDEDFSLLQGEIYGPRILKAQPADSSIKVIREMIKLGLNVFIISHKTKVPYKGPKFDLHYSARDWLSFYSFLSPHGANLKEDQIFFKTSKQEKINKIHDLKCDFFIDDLPEILDLVNPDVKKILYNNPKIPINSSYDFTSTNWELIGKYIFSFL